MPRNVKKQIILSFSGGKDSLLSLYRLNLGKEFEVVSLLTTLSEDGKVLMHGFNSSLLDEQAVALALPLYKITIPKVDSEQSKYGSKMREVLDGFKSKGIRHVAFGDIFLEDIKKFREEKLSIVGMEGVFPLWGENSWYIAREFLDLGFKAVITCVNTRLISREWVGREYDDEFLEYLETKGGVDLCGENGEFHTFVYGGPCFQKEVKYRFDFKTPNIHNEFYACGAYSL